MTGSAFDPVATSACFVLGHEHSDGASAMITGAALGAPGALSATIARALAEAGVAAGIDVCDDSADPDGLALARVFSSGSRALVVADDPHGGSVALVVEPP